MIHASNEFGYQLRVEDNRRYLEYVDITLSGGGKTLNLTNEDLWGGGLSVEDAVSSESSFDIGSAIINKCTVVINNIYDTYSEYDFTDAEVVAWIGLELPGGRIEKLRKGTYAVDEASYNGSIITLSCLDNMRKFDKPYTESSLKYPATLKVIVRDACDRCGVTLQTYDFPHDDFVVQERPNDEAVTFREIISWCAQIAGCFCRCDTLGRLELKWYDQELLEATGLDGGYFDSGSLYQSGDNADGGTFRPWNTGYEFDAGTFEELNKVHNIYSNYSIDISMDDVVITGVRVLEKTKEDNKDAIVTYQSGRDGYVISVENNELIKGGAGQQVSNWLGQQLIGFRFRRANVSHASDPTIEAGDVGFLTDRKGNVYRMVISSTRFSTGGSQTTISSAENPLRNSAARFSAETKNYVDYRKDIEKEKTDREKAQEELKERIDNSSGLYTTEVTQPDGSTIFYMHDKPALAESMIVWKMTAEAWGVSTDGGKTYNAGMTVDGDTIVRILTAVGVNADWIKTGALRIEKNGKTMVNMDFDTGVVDMVVNSFSLTSGKTIEQIAQEEAGEQVNDFIAAVYDPTVANLQSQIDGQIETWYYDYEPTLYNAPASSWTTEAERARHEGDLYYWKSKGYSYRFFKDGYTWKWQLITDSDITKALQEASKAQDTADAKRRVFVSTPYPPYDKGDLWTQGASGDIMTCVNGRQSGSYSSADWEKLNKYIDQAAANAAASNAVSSQTQTDILNRLTNNGEDNGIYLLNGRLYVSFSAMRGGELTLGGANNIDGKLAVRNRTGDNIGGWNDEGLYAYGPYFWTEAFNPPYFFLPVCGHAIYMNSGNAIDYSETLSEKSLAFNIEHYWGTYDEHAAKLSIGGGGTIRSHMDDSGKSIEIVEISSNAYDKSQLKFYVRAKTTMYGTLSLIDVKKVSSSNALVLNGSEVSYISSSSARYKSIGREMGAEDIEDLYNIQPMWAKYKPDYLSEDDERYNVEFPMFIAEDVEKYAPLAVDHDENGQTENWNYRVMIPYMFQMIKSQKETIDNQKRDIDELTKRLERLETLVLKGDENQWQS